MTAEQPTATDDAHTSAAAETAAFQADIATRLRAARERRGLTRADLALAAGMAPRLLERAEEQGRIGVSELYSLCAPLHIDPLEILSGDPAGGDDAALALTATPAAWLLDEDASACLRALAHWYSQDAHLTRIAAPDPAPRTPPSLAERGVVDAVTEALPRVDMPRPQLEWPEPDQRWEPGRWEGLAESATLALLRGAGLPADAPTTLAALADAYGIPHGRRPLPDRVRAAAGYADGRPLLVANSERADAVADRGALHLLVHLLCGHITLAAFNSIERPGSRNRYDCTGVSQDVCVVAEDVTTRLRLGPAGMAAAEAAAAEAAERAEAARQRRTDAWLAEAALVDVAGPGGPGPFEDSALYPVDVSDRLYRDIAPADDPDMTGRGDGATVLPAALAWRHLRVHATGLGGPLDVLALGVGRAGHPGEDDVIDADLQRRRVSAQLKAWNDDQVAALFDRGDAREAD